MREDRKTIAFFPRTAEGPALNCVGIAQAVRDLGHRAVFITWPQAEELFASYGFETFTVEGATGEGASGSFVTAHAADPTKGPIEQLDGCVKDGWLYHVQLAERVEQGLPETLHKAQPDLICLDQLVLFPAVKRFGVPWVRILSGSENAIDDPDIPPYLSGCGEADGACSESFRERFAEVIRPVHDRFNAFLQRCGEQPYRAGQFLEPSPWMNLLLWPQALRWPRRHALDPARFQYLEGCLREEADHEVPPFIMNRDKPLLYLSLGSLGAADIALMKRLIATLGRLPYRVVVNIGKHAQHYDESEVPPNVLLESWCPQPSIIAQVDAVIHHGGNGTFTECLYYAKPSLIMPFEWDGHDVATRAEETGHGLKLHRYDWREAELVEKLEILLNEPERQATLEATAARMRAEDGRRKAAALLDRLAQNSPTVPA